MQKMTDRSQKQWGSIFPDRDRKIPVLSILETKIAVSRTTSLIISKSRSDLHEIWWVNMGLVVVFVGGAAWPHIQSKKADKCYTDWKELEISDSILYADARRHSIPALLWRTSISSDIQRGTGQYTEFRGMVWDIKSKFSKQIRMAILVFQMFKLAIFTMWRYASAVYAVTVYPSQAGVWHKLLKYTSPHKHNSLKQSSFLTPKVLMKVQWGHPSEAPNVQWVGKTCYFWQIICYIMHGTR